MPGWKTILGLATLCVLQFASAWAGNVSDEVSKAYQTHILGVRYPIHPGDQVFDSAGQPINTGPQPAWEIYGGVLIQKLHLESNALRIEGQRVVPTKRVEKNKPVVGSLGKVSFRIGLDHPVTSFEDVRTVLGRVFYLDENDVEHQKPELRRTGDGIENQQVYRCGKPGDGAAFPKPQYTPEPDFSEKARHEKLQGTVLLTVVVDKTGEISSVKVDRGLGDGLDQNAMDAVRKWRFLPATLSNQPVNVRMNVEVQFHLY